MTAAGGAIAQQSGVPVWIQTAADAWPQPRGVQSLASRIPKEREIRTILCPPAREQFCQRVEAWMGVARHSYLPSRKMRRLRWETH